MGVNCYLNRRLYCTSPLYCHTLTTVPLCGRNSASMMLDKLQKGGMKLTLNETWPSAKMQSILRWMLLSGRRRMLWAICTRSYMRGTCPGHMKSLFRTYKELGLRSPRWENDIYVPTLKFKWMAYSFIQKAGTEWNSLSIPIRHSDGTSKDRIKQYYINMTCNQCRICMYRGQASIAFQTFDVMMMKRLVLFRKKMGKVTITPVDERWERVQSLFEQMKAKHGSTYSGLQYRLWAEAVTSDSHSSTEEPLLGSMFRRQTTCKSSVIAHAQLHRSFCQYSCLAPSCSSTWFKSNPNACKTWYLVNNIASAQGKLTFVFSLISYATFILSERMLQEQEAELFYFLAVFVPK